LNGRNLIEREWRGIMIFVCYPKCTTCRKAKKWLESNGIAFEERHIKENNPTIEELKDRLPTMSEDEQYSLLASDGMIVKRPILIGDDFVLVGFDETAWKAALDVE